MKELTLQVDPDRTALPETGIYVRGLDASGQWGARDIAHLTRESLLAWLRHDYDGGANWRAENCVGVLLGHGNLHDVRVVYRVLPDGELDK